MTQDQQQQRINFMLQCNRELIERIQKELDYATMVVPCAGEACRVEKVDLEARQEVTDVKVGF
jgi:hypothetical protein